MWARVVWRAQAAVACVGPSRMAAPNRWSPRAFTCVFLTLVHLYFVGVTRILNFPQMEQISTNEATDTIFPVSFCASYREPQSAAFQWVRRGRSRGLMSFLAQLAAAKETFVLFIRQAILSVFADSEASSGQFVTGDGLCHHVARQNTNKH